MYRGYIIGGGVIALLAALFFVSPFLQDLFFIVVKDAGDFASQNTALAVSFFILLAAISSMVSPFSSVPVIPFAVTLWGVGVTTTLLVLGWLIGDVIAYAIGRYAAHPLIAQFVKEKKLARYRRYFSDHATFLRALLVRLALPAEIGYAFGLIKYNFGSYILVTFITEAIFAVPTVLAVDALIALHPTVFAVWVLALVAVIITFYFLFRVVLWREK